MSEEQWAEKLELLTRRVEMLEAMVAERGIQASRMPKRLPFLDESPLSALAKPDGYALLSAAIDRWRLLLMEHSSQPSLEIARFDFYLESFPYERFYDDLAELIHQGVFIYSSNVVAWYFVMHSNLSVSHYTLYTSLLSNVRRKMLKLS